MEIKSTTQYDMFRLIKGNRPVRRMRVRMLADSIGRNNLLETHPILINNQMEVIDGQHRLAAAEALKTPIYYVTGNGLTLKDAMEVNENLAKWSTRNYVESYAEFKDDYKTLLEFMNNYGFAATVAGALLAGKSDPTAVRGFRNVIANGNFKVKSEEWAEEIAELIETIKPFCKGTFYRNREFVIALTEINKQVPTTQIKKTFQTVKPVWEMRATWRQYLEDFEKLYFKAYKKSIHLY